uniref:Uncharacterized protein n=1 Tax=Vespula pensylvanica TaxID=30213 RepID=A0A834P2F5_VESPE|nr:hypothetical protein H0235_008086 [Vespula pensylvanica]
MPVAEPEAGSRVRYSGDARRTYPVSIVPRADDDDYDYDYDDNDTIGIATHYADKAFTWTLPLYRSSTTQHYQENYSQAKRLSHICIVSLFVRFDSMIKSFHIVPLLSKLGDYVRIRRKAERRSRKARLRWKKMLAQTQELSAAPRSRLSNSKMLSA